MSTLSAQHALFADRCSAIDTENAFKLGPLIAQAEANGEPVIKLNLGEPDFNVPDPVKNEIKKQLDLNNTHYCDPKGLPSLRQAIANQMYQMRGLDVAPERIVVFPGCKPAIGFAQQIYCNPGDEVIYPSPGFPIYESFIRYVGAVPVPLHLREETGFSLRAEDLEPLINNRTRLIYLNFPSNPTGGVAAPDQLEAIAAVIRDKCDPNVRIFSDEIYEYITFDDQKHVSIAAYPGMAERTIIASGMSKTFAWTGGRIGYAVLPTVEEADAFKNLNINYFSCVPPYNQEGAREALENEEVRQEVKSMVKTLQNRRDVIWEKLNQIEGISCFKPSGAFYLFPNVADACRNLGAFEAYQQLPAEYQARTSPSTLLQMFALFHHKVALMDRRSFGRIGSEDQHYLRLSCAAELSVLEEGVHRLDAACRDVEGFRAFVEKGDHLA